MSISSPGPWRRQDSKDAIVLTFLETRLLDETQVRAVGEQLLQAASEGGSRSLILNLASVEYISSHMVAKLLSVQQRAHALGGKLILCGVRPRIYTALCTANLDKVLDVRPLVDASQASSHPEADSDPEATRPVE